MNINTMLSALKVIKGVMKLTNDILRYIHACIIIIHTIWIAGLLYNDYAGIFDYSLSLLLVTGN